MGKKGGIPIVGPAYGFLSGSDDAAKAAGKAAGQQADVSAQMRQQILDEAAKQDTALKGREQRTMDLAAASPQELAAYTSSLNASQKQLEQRQRFIDAIDPALMEASKQVLSLLRGQNAPSMGPLMQQRQSQRDQLVSSLRRQFGSETTSAAQQALQKFDLETNSMTQQAQQSALGQAFGIAQGGQGFTALPEIGAVGASGGMFGGLQQRQLGAYSDFTGRLQNQGAATLGALSGTSQQMINSAGADQVSALMSARAQGQLFNQAVGAGMGYMTGGASSLAGLMGGTGAGSSGAGNAGSSGGYQLSNAGTTNSNYWSTNPYK